MNENGKSWLVIVLCAAGIALLAGLGYSLREKQSSFNQSSDRILIAADDLRKSLYQSAEADAPVPADAEAAQDPVEEPGKGAGPGTLALSETETAFETGTAFETETATEAETLSEAEAAPAGKSPLRQIMNPEKPVYGRIIFVGDSRTVGMQRSVNRYTDPCVFIGASGEGYLWFERSGIHRLERTILRYPDTPVVFNLGVNDTMFIQQYIRIYRSLIDEYPDTSFWFLSVNPVTEESLMVPDSDVVEFNRLLKEAFPRQYLDSYSWMKENEFECVDGIHYSEKTYRDIHDFVFDQLFGAQEETETALSGEPGTALPAEPETSDS